MANKLFSAESMKRLLWHGFSLLSLILLIAAASALWYYGVRDGQSALQDGRRLVLDLSTGKMDGWQAGMPRKGISHDHHADESKDNKSENDDHKNDEHKDDHVADDSHDADDHHDNEEMHSDHDAHHDEMHDDDHQDAHDADKEISEDHHGEDDAHHKDDAHDTDDHHDSEPHHDDALPENSSVKDETHNKGDEKIAQDEHDAKDTQERIVPSVTAVHGINDALTEKSEEGLLPRIGDDGTMPWQYYSKAAQFKGDFPYIAIIVTGVGTSKSMTESALELPENITLSFSPYARNVESWATAARVTGHEVMLDLPLQPADYPASDPGPYGLLVEAKPGANDKKLEWLLSRFGAFTGVLAPFNEGFIQDTYSFAALSEALSKRGLLFALSHDVVKDNAKKVIEDSKTPLLVADVIIDEDLHENAIKARIATLQQIAKKKGYAIGIAHNYPVSLDELNRLPEVLKEAGFMLMPLSYIAKKHFH